MNIILNNIKAAQLQARKDRNKDVAGLLTTLMSDIQMIGKNDNGRETTDADSISTIKKYLNNIEETIKVVTDETIVTLQRAEQNVLNKFLPTQLSDQELETKIVEFIVNLQATTIKDMGKVMKALKDAHGGLYDGSKASMIFKSTIAK
jgi:uncharacterized protein YqeY